MERAHERDRRVFVGEARRRVRRGPEAIHVNVVSVAEGDFVVVPVGIAMAIGHTGTEACRDRSGECRA